VLIGSIEIPNLTVSPTEHARSLREKESNHPTSIIISQINDPLLTHLLTLSINSKKSTVENLLQSLLHYYSKLYKKLYYTFILDYYSA